VIESWNCEERITDKLDLSPTLKHGIFNKIHKRKYF